MQEYSNPVAIAVIGEQRKFYTNACTAQTEAAAAGGYVLPANATPGKVANGYIVAPGDKVVVLHHGVKASCWQIKATVVKVNAKTVTVDLRFKGRTTGALRTERRAIANDKIWRCDWGE